MVNLSFQCYSVTVLLSMKKFVKGINLPFKMSFTQSSPLPIGRIKETWGLYGNTSRKKQNKEYPFYRCQSCLVSLISVKGSRGHTVTDRMRERGLGMDLLVSLLVCMYVCVLAVAYVLMPPAQCISNINLNIDFTCMCMWSLYIFYWGLFTLELWHQKLEFIVLLWKLCCQHYVDFHKIRS